MKTWIIVANRSQQAAKRALLQPVRSPCRERDRCHQRGEDRPVRQLATQRAKQLGDAWYTLNAEGHFALLLQHEPHRLRKAQRHDRQIVLAQSQRREPQGNGRHRSHQRGNGKREYQGPTFERQQRTGIGTQRKKCDMTEIDQSSLTVLQIETDREECIDHDH
jgi:hypothetical protein